MRTARTLTLAAATLALAVGPAHAAKKFYVYNLTTATDFPGVYVAPAGTQKWGSNQALNDSDKVLQTTERLLIKDIGPGHYDVKFVDGKGKSCVKHDVDLTQQTTFDVKDGDLTACQ